MEQEIIKPVEKELIKSELTPERQLRMTNRSHNEIYIIDAHNAPNTLNEIGRLREIVFREAGGGTGKALDLDEFDTMDNCYKQLIVWNPEAEEIIGGYRYILGKDIDIDKNGQPILATSHMFHFSERFMKDYMPWTIELGRSFVTLEYQNTQKNPSKSLFALDNLWDGLGALTVIQPDVKYFFGKMTMYPSYIRKGRDMILYFLKKHFEDKDNLILPMNPLKDRDRPEGVGGALLRGVVQGRLQDSQSRDTQSRIQHPAACQCLYGTEPHDEALRHCHQRRIWRCRGNGHSHCRG